MVNSKLVRQALGVLFMIGRRRKRIDLIQHFKKLILKDLKPLLNLISQEVTTLNTFSYAFPYMLSFSISSAINKIELLRRLEDPSRVEKNVVSSVLQIIEEMREYIVSSEAPIGLKAKSLSVIATAKLVFDKYNDAIVLMKKIQKLINAIRNPLTRSNVIRDVLYNLGSINRLVRRDSIAIPDEILNRLTGILAEVIKRNISEADIIDDPFIRGRIYTNLGFGARMFHIVINRGTIAEWFDINQAQRLALDGLSEAEKTRDWYEKSFLLADSAMVLAISGEDTVGLANEKFNEAAEIAFKHISDDPSRAAYLIGRIAHDKAYTRFYMDSEKFFYESIVLLIETLGIEAGMSTIKKILKLAIKTRYYYIVYETMRDWLLPLIDQIRSISQRARLLAISSHLVLPLSMNWAISLARESLSMVRNVIENESLSIYYDYIPLGRPLLYASEILEYIPALSNAAYILPVESKKILSGVTTILESLLRIHLKSIKRRMSIDIGKSMVTFSKKLGNSLVALKSIPAFYTILNDIAHRFFHDLDNILSAKYGEKQIRSLIPYSYFAYGIAQGDIHRASNIVRKIIERMFVYDKTMWRFKNETLPETLTKDRYLVEILGEILGVIVEIGFRASNTLRDTITRIIIDLSEHIESKIYTRLLVSILERIKNRIVAKRLLVNTINVLLDEKKIRRKDLPNKFFRVIKNIDSALAKTIVEEIA